MGFYSLAGDLVVDPAIGFFHADAELGVGLPVHELFDEGVVAVAAVDALGGLEIVGAFELDAGDVFDDVDELVDGDQFVAAEVDGLDDVAPEEVLGSLEAIGDVHEGPGLMSVAPDFDIVFTGEFGFDDFSADRGGGFFAATVVGAVGSVNVVEAGDAGDEAEIFAEMSAHAFAE